MWYGKCVENGENVFKHMENEKKIIALWNNESNSSFSSRPTEATELEIYKCWVNLI